MSNRIVPYCTLLFVVLTSTVIAWAPFLMKGQFSTIYKNFDGSLYIIPAKTGYNPESFKLIDREPTLPHNPLYYSAHLPLYPFFIYLGAFAVGFLKSMVGITLLSSIVVAWFFYYMLKKLSLTKYPLILTILFLFLPRFLVVRSVGSPEPLFLLFILGSLFFFEKKNYLLAGILGGLATMTKTPGILLFPAYILVIIESYVMSAKAEIHSKILDFKWLYLLLIPLGLLAVFSIYYIQYKDFFAYFHSGDNIHLLYPYAVFNSAAPWVGTAWLEDILFYFALYTASAVALWKSKHRSFFYFAVVFLTATLFVQHRDISRYSLPLWPLALIAFEHIVTSKKALLVAGILILGVYMYAWNFLGANVMPISEWLPFL
jgi:Gpi18-like mannosyltransferase